MLLLFSSLCVFSDAQGWKIGIETGLRISKPPHYHSHIGCDIGARTEFSLLSVDQHNIFLAPSIVLSWRGWKDYVSDMLDESLSSEWNCDVYYLDIPLQVGYKYIASASYNLYAEAGGYISYGLSGKSKLDFNGEDWGDKNIFKSGLYKNFDYGTKIGIGINLKQWQLGIEWSRSWQKPTTGNWNGINPIDSSVIIRLCYFLRNWKF